MKTPLETSPYKLIQEELRHNPWRLLVAVICLNQTSAKQARPVLDNFFKIWPDPESAALAIPDLVTDVIRPLGLQRKRARNIISMSQEFLRGEFRDPDELPGIGKYGADSYRLFIENVLILDVEDKELRNYVEWAQRRHGDVDDRGIRSGLSKSVDGA